MRSLHKIDVMDGNVEKRFGAPRSRDYPALIRRHCVQWLVFLCLSVIAVCSHGATSRDSVMETTVTTNSASPYITFNWTNKSAYATYIYRRVKGAETWEPRIAVGAGIYTYADPTAEPGVAYEYSLASSASSPYCGIVAGYNIPLVESRGKVILLVDNTMAVALAPEIGQLEKNLVADGWTVLRHDVPRETVAPNNNLSTSWAARIAEQQAMRAIVQADYNTAPGSDWALFILGRIPVPYTGSMAFDGHGDHGGAWSTDSYYSDVDGVWTDSSVNTGTSGLADPRCYNLPGDGKFDPYVLPSNVELQCGRVDLSNMAGVPTGMSEVELLRQYLVRNHNFRSVQAPYENVARRGIVDDNFNAYAASGWSSGIGFFGRNTGQMDAADWFATLSTTPMLFAYGSGGGSFTSANGVGNSVADFAKTDSKAVFTQLFGSYFGDFDSANNFMRCPLAGTANSLGLACVWSADSFVPIPLYHMALGDPIGYCVRKATNSRNWQGTVNGYTCAELMGDPTLRLHSIAPPAKVIATSTAGGITLNWLASPDSTLSGYHVYRSTSTTGPFIRLTGAPANGTNPTGSCLSAGTLVYTDADPGLASGMDYTYLVKAVRMEVSASGTYANQSLGEAVTITHLALNPIPSAPTRLSVSRTGTTTCVLVWEDNAGDEVHYLVERRNPSTGGWSQITSLEADTTTYTDAGAVAGQIVHYRVRAANAHGNSSYSNVAADYNRAGLLCDSDYAYTTIKNISTKSIGSFKAVATRCNGGAGDVSVNYATSDVHSTAGVDYTPASGTIAWSHGDTSGKPVSINITNLAGAQLTKIFKLSYSNPTNGLALGTPIETYVFITDPTARTLPSPWATMTIGGIYATREGYAEYANGSFGLAAQCSDVYANSSGDACRFIYQSIVGDFQLTARLVLLSNTGNVVRGGLMIRNDLTSNSVMDWIHSTSSSRTRYTRAVKSTSPTETVIGSPATNPHWMRMTRAGSAVTVEHSSDGLQWSNATTVTLSSLNSTAYVGLAVTTDKTDANRSANNVVGSLGYARFDNVSLTTTVYSPVGNIASLSASSGTVAGGIALNWSGATNATTYQIERSLAASNGFTKIATINAPTVTYADTGLTIDTTYYYRVIAQNPAYSSTYTTVVSAQPYLPSDVSGWRYVTFGDSAIDEGWSGDLDAPCGDQISNLMKYALGIPVFDSDWNPIYTSPTSLPVIQKQFVGLDQYLTCAFTHNKKAGDLTVIVEVTNDLNAGIWTAIDPLDPANQISVTDNVPSQGVETIVVKDTQPMSASNKRFMRFKVLH